MKLALLIMLAAAMTVLFFCGYFGGVIKEKLGQNWLYAAPITIAVLMFNIILAIYAMAQSGRF